MAKRDCEPSSSQSTFCKICMETAEAAEMFRNSNCPHAFCRSCLCGYIGAKVRENASAAVKCPEIGCEGVLEPEFCKDMLPQTVPERWAYAPCESMVPPSQRLYCPFKDCSKLVLQDSGERLGQSECPYCRRLICADCKVAWHSRMSCEEFQNFGEGIDREREEDLLLLDVAKDKKWKRCPGCKYFVEKTDGCPHIVCRF